MQPRYLLSLYRREWATTAAFGPLDAGLAWFFFYEQPRIHYRRSVLSNASARYLVQPLPHKDNERAWIDLRMVDTNLTLILLDSFPAGSRTANTDEERAMLRRWHEQVSALVDSFLAWFDQDRARIAALVGATPATHPLDRVLAEYEHRRAAGEKLNLREIAEERGVKYGSLRKRRSAQLRNKREQ